MYKRFSIIMLAVALSSCGTPQQKASALEENKEAKSLLEGIWLDDNTETALLRVKGDTLFYAGCQSLRCKTSFDSWIS